MVTAEEGNRKRCARRSGLDQNRKDTLTKRQRSRENQQGKEIVDGHQKSKRHGTRGKETEWCLTDAFRTVDHTNWGFSANPKWDAGGKNAPHVRGQKRKHGGGERNPDHVTGKGSRTREEEGGNRKPTPPHQKLEKRK